MAAKTSPALKSLMPFGKSILHKVAEKYNYAILGLNVGNSNTSYDFTETEFKVLLHTGTGVIDENNNPWLLATIPGDEAGKLFSYEIRTNQGGKWSADKDASEKVLSEWKSSDCLIALKCDNIPVLKALVGVLNEEKVFLSCLLRVNLSIGEDKIPEIQEKLRTYFKFVKENQKPLPPKEDTQNYEAIGILNKYMGVPQLSFLGLPERDELDTEYGLPTGNKIKVSVPFEGNYPFEIEKFIFSPPEIESASTTKKSWSSGTSVNVEGYNSNNAWKFIKENYTEMSEFFSEKMPGITQAQITSIALSLAGVQVLPRLFPNVAYVPNISQEMSLNNGNTPKPIEQELLEIKKEVVGNENNLKAQIISWFKREKLNPENWLAKHTTDEEYALFLEIVNSEIYKRKKMDVQKWVGVKLGMPDTPVPITALGNLEDISELAKLCIDADTRLVIDQDATI